MSKEDQELSRLIDDGDFGGMMEYYRKKYPDRFRKSFAPREEVRVYIPKGVKVRIVRT